MLEVASIAGCVPAPLPSDLITSALSRLGRPSVRRYFSRLYPLALPQLFMQRIAGHGLPTDDSYPLFSTFLQVTQSRRTPDINTFLSFLNGGEEEGEGLEDVLQVFSTQTRLVRNLTATRESPSRRGLRGLLGFLRFARELDELLVRSAEHRILQSAFWHYHGYWFQQLGLQLAGVLATTIESYRDQVGEPTSERERVLIEKTHADMDVAHLALQRLCSGVYSAALDTRLYIALPQADVVRAVATISPSIVSARGIPALVDISPFLIPADSRIRGEIQIAAQSDARVLLSGESGIGEEVIARTIHKLSRRRSAPFVVVNCAGLPETLLESELFGHVKGSFTGAYRDKPGKLEMAHNGTVFMDEVGEMTLRMQGLLLRFFENGHVQRVGSDR